MSRWNHSISTLLVLALLAWAHVGGVVRGYLCDCGGKISVTQLDHCHGPHSEACHDDADDRDAHQPHHHEDDTDSHEHEALVDTFQARLHDVVSHNVNAPFLTQFDLPAWQFTSVLPPDALEASHRLRAHGRPRPCPGLAAWPHRLSETIALRI